MKNKPLSSPEPVSPATRAEVDAFLEGLQEFRAKGDQPLDEAEVKKYDEAGVKAYLEDDCWVAARHRASHHDGYSEVSHQGPSGWQRRKHAEAVKEKAEEKNFVESRVKARVQKEARAGQKEESKQAQVTPISALIRPFARNQDRQDCNGDPYS
jgi:hypothetical protein